MTNLISITENLKNISAQTPARFIGVSAINLINAGILANSTQECASEASRIYSRKNGGMWKKIQSDAIRTLKTAEANGLSIEKPYVIKNGIVYGLVGGDLSPLFGKEHLNVG